jgi:nitrogen fixation/metabolism regulation signal transduction histidine kinase
MILRRSQRPFWRTRTLRYTLIVTGAIGGVLLFLLASASSNTPLFEKAYPFLLGANATIALTMVLLVGIQVWRLGKRFRAGVFGARMMARFALSFALMGLVPGVVIYLVSVQFLSRSIESWFDVRVDRALDAGLTLGRTMLDSMLSDLNAKARNMSLSLADASDSELAKQLNRLRDQSGVQEALIFNSSRVVASAGGGSLDTLVPEMPSADVLRQLKLTRSYSRVESPQRDTEAARGGLQMRVIVPIPSSDLSLFQSDPLYLQLLQNVPSAVAANLDEAQNGVQDYRELSLSRTALRGMYTVTLTLALLLSVFAALAVAFLLATWLTAPLLLLAEGTKAVAGGDYSPMPEIKTRDELGTLTQSFNVMTRQLGEARAVVERNRAQLENAKTYLESILSHLSAGVLVFDEQFRLVTANHGAERILGTSLADRLGQPLGTALGLGKLSEMIERAFDEQAAVGPDWQKQIELSRGAGGLALEGSGANAQGEANGTGDPLTLLARGSRCPVGDAVGYLVVFDDVSDVISAQRSIAWGEVARRLAHEIKNPLTPIQLSAERLQMKLQGKLPEHYAEVLERGVTTIVNQVAAMQQMVDDFRDFARAPPAAMAAVDLNALVSEVLALYGAGSGGDTQGELIMELEPELPLILGDATRLRQVIHNLVQNAQDATYETPRARIVFQTERVDSRAGGPSRPGRDAMVRLTVSDNGSGFPARILARAFEPYVTTKSRGTGLGLAVVKKIADEHEARIDLRNRDEGGASVSLLFTKLAGRQLAVA